MGCTPSKNHPSYSIQSKYIPSDPPPPPPSWLGVRITDLHPTGSSRSCGSTVEPTYNLQKRLYNHPATFALHTDFVNHSILGRGKFGEVTLVKSKHDGRYYAVKVILKPVIYARKMRSGVEGEIAVGMGCRHPAAVGGVAWGEVVVSESTDGIGLLTEFCPGGELFTRLRLLTRFPPDVTKYYAFQIALLLKHLHGCNIIHRDLKPENIFISWDGRIKVGDFGFCIKCDADNGDGGEGKGFGDDGQIIGQNCGTAMYIAPEIASGHKATGHSFPVDWWALGVMVYEMLVGTAPFGDSQATPKFEILNRVNKGKVKYPRKYIDADAKELISGLLEMDQKKRWKYEDFVGCKWCEGVNPDDILHNRIKPPWMPPPLPPSLPPPDTRFFLKWKAKKPQILKQEEKERTELQKAGGEGWDYTKFKGWDWEDWWGNRGGSGVGKGRRRGVCEEVYGSGDVWRLDNNVGSARCSGNGKGDDDKLRKKNREKDGQSSPSKSSRRSTVSGAGKKDMSSQVLAVNLAKRKAKSLRGKKIHV